jgi:hypothetical protein
MVQSTFVDITAVWSLRHASSIPEKHQGTLVQVPWASIRREGRMLRILDCGAHSQRDGWLYVQRIQRHTIKKALSIERSLGVGLLPPQPWSY